MFVQSIYFLFLMLAPIFVFSESDERASVQDVKKEYKDETSETLHQITINGQAVSYKAVAGTLLLKDEKGDPQASVFYVSYAKEGVINREDRPITFCFNGGPGSSSVWLHLGTFGPRRIQMNEKGDSLPPYHLADNPYSLLDLTDLVFIDPVSTGFSRAIPPQNAKQYHSVQEDVKTIAEFIRIYLTRFNRWDSPKFLAGESYGTTRAVALAEYLHDNSFIYVNGIILVSSILDFQSIDSNTGNDLAYLNFLPSYTATAWYHRKLAPELQKDLPSTLEKVESFVNNEYATALFKGDLLPEKERQSIANKIAYFTGLTPEYVERSQLRINNNRFATELIWDQKKTLGRFDGRIVGYNFDDVKDSTQYDPSFELVLGSFTAAMNNYLKEELKWEKDGDYKILADVHPWDYSAAATNQYLKVTDKLKAVLIKNENLRVFVASGYYDLATPYFGTKYTFNHLGIDPALSSHITLKYYEGGHMMYTYYPTFVKMKKDITDFYIQTMELQKE